MFYRYALHWCIEIIFNNHTLKHYPDTNRSDNVLIYMWRQFCESFPEPHCDDDATSRCNNKEYELHRIPLPSVASATVSLSIRHIRPTPSTKVAILNPFTPKSDQFQISPAALQEILHHTVWRTWLTQMKDDYTANSLTTSPIQFSIKGWENVIFELESERVGNWSSNFPAVNLGDFRRLKATQAFQDIMFIATFSDLRRLRATLI